MPRIYTASPLGLVPDLFGSTENDEASKNPYNQSGSTVNSLFSSKHVILKRDSNKLFSDPLSFGDRTIIHKDDVYDISTANILKVLDGYPSMKLKASDFIYAKDYGVYPNNRLIICRRFPSPVGDDLTSESLKETEPSVTLLTWFGEDQNPIDFSFGEKWKKTNETLKEVLNDFGKDIGVKAIESAGLGGRLAKLGDAVPLPGITEVLQRQVLAKLGLIGENSSKLPVGDPNLIMESMRRDTVNMETPGSGLTGEIKVKVVCKWEQKFIAGVDPTFVYYDLLRTILSFGGSNATFYLGASKLASGVDEFLKKLSQDPFELIQDFVGKLTDTLKTFLEKVKQFFVEGKAVEDDNNQKAPLSGEETSSFNSFIDKAESITKSITSFVAYKYKIRIMGILNYLTGTPSGPWHVTIGNPMRPILSSGDMVTQNVTVKLGPTLSFNDLPSTIECEFELLSARSLGIGEIFGKLSCGQVRVTKPNPNYIGLSSGPPYLSPEQLKTAGVPQNLEILTSLDDPSFYNTNSDKEFRRGQGLGVGVELDVLAQTDQNAGIQQSSDISGDNPRESGPSVINSNQDGTQQQATNQNTESNEKKTTVDEKDGESATKSADWVQGEVIRSDELDNNSPIGLTRLIVSWKVEKGSEPGLYCGSWKAFKGGVVIDSGDETCGKNAQAVIDSVRAEAEYAFDIETRPTF